jgi:hypothetical protein
MLGLFQSVPLNINSFITNLAMLFYTLPCRIFQTFGVVFILARLRAIILFVVKLIWLPFKRFATDRAIDDYSRSRMRLCTSGTTYAAIRFVAVAQTIGPHKKSLTTFRALSRCLHKANITQVLLKSKVVGGAGIDVLGNRISGSIKAGLNKSPEA